MSRYEQSLREIFVYADSKRVTVRRQFIISLKELYENPAAVQEIHDNSEVDGNGQFSWTTILHKIHAVCLLEAEKRKSVDSQSICSLMFTTVSIASSKPGIYLKCSDLLSLVLQILDSQRYVDYQKTYMEILFNCVLPIRQYRAAMSLEHWKELLRLCIELYENQSDESYQSFILKGFQDVVRYGCLQSHLVLDVKKILPFLERLFENVTLDDKSGKAIKVFQLANTICQQIGTESRMALCRFGESFLKRAIRLNGNDEKYDWLLFMVRVHHPGALSIERVDACVHDANAWNEILQDIFAMILRDSKSEEQSENFIDLACEVSRQLNPDSVIEVMPLDSDLYSRPTKRRRVSIGFQGALNMLDGTEVDAAWPVIYTTALIEKYPESMKVNNYVPLLEIVIRHLKTCKKKDILDYLYGLCKVLVEVEDRFPNAYDQIDNPELIWAKVWDVALRSVSMNQIEESGHRLLQSLIQKKKMTNPMTFLKLYLNDTFKWSSSSIRTLLVFCEHNMIPDCKATRESDSGFDPNDSEPNKIRLLKWVLSIPLDKLTAEFPIEAIGELMVGLTLNSWYMKDKANLVNARGPTNTASPGTTFESSILDNTEPSILKKIETSYLVTMFEISLRDEVGTKIVHTNEKRKMRILYQKDAVNLLIQKLSENTLNIETTEVDLLVVQTALVAKVFTNLKFLNMIQDEVEECRLTDTMKRSLEIISRWSVTKSDLKMSGKRREFKHVLKALQLLYETSYDNNVVDIILTSSTDEFRENLFILTEVNDGNRFVDDDDYVITDFDEFAYKRKHLEKLRKNQKNDGLSSLDRIRLEAIKALTSFSCRSDSDTISGIQKKVLERILNHRNYKLSQLADFKMAVTVLGSMVKCKAEYFGEKMVRRSIKFFLDVCREWHNDQDAARIILCLLRDLLGHFTHFGNKNALQPLKAFRLLLQGNKYGPLVYVEFIKCLCSIACRDPSFVARWDKGPENKEQIPVVEEVLVYVNSPFHVVRLEAIKCLHVLFSLKGKEFQWQNEFFCKLRDVAMNSFLVEGDLVGLEKKDEKFTRIASALHAFAAVVTSSAIFRNEALLSMLQLAADKNLKTEIVKTLKLIGKELHIDDPCSIVEDNLNYLLTYWLKKKYSLEKFPWALTGCTSEENFLRMYMHILVPILIQNRDLADVAALCENLGLAFEENIEKCFPRIMSWLLPYVSADPSNPPRELQLDDLRRATEVFQLMNLNEKEFQSIQRLSVLLDNNLEKVIVTLIKRLHDEDNFKQMLTVDPKVYFPLPDPPYFGTECIIRSFRYLEEHLMTAGQSLVYHLANEKQSALQKVLMDLTCSIHEVKFVEYKLKAFHHYIFFCNMLLQELCLAQFGMSGYVIRDVCHTLVHLIEQDIDPISEIACKYFYGFLKSILPVRHMEVKQNLSCIVTSLIPIAKSGKICAANLLTYLIVDQNENLCDTIEKLDPFPADEVFDKMREIHHNLKYKFGKDCNLEMEIRHFLEAGSKESSRCSVEGLANLNKLLSTRKTELKHMYNSLETMQGFSEDCASSILHRLICKLVKLTFSLDPIIPLEAAKCLGELGPADLTTMILQPENSHMQETSDSMSMFTYRVVALLSDFLTQPDMKLFKASADTLYTIGASYWSLTLSKNLEHFKNRIDGAEPLVHFEYIRPFLTTSCPAKQTVGIDRKEFESRIDGNYTLWTGRQNSSHADWVIDLTCNILACFSGSYLDHLIPVCKAEISFCEAILPWIVDLIIHTDEGLIGKVCCDINEFFHHHYNWKMAKVGQDLAPNALQKSICSNHKSVQCMLNVVHFIRLQSKDNFQLEFNYLYIAKAAQYCSAYFTSVLYAELWCEKLLRESCGTKDMAVIEYICELESENGKVLQDILREACIQIGDPDAIYGCGSSHLRDPSARIQHYVHLNKWDEVMLSYDIQLSLGSNTATRGLLDAMQHSGLQSLLGGFIKNASRTETIDDYQYDCAWRLSNWNMMMTQEMFDSQAHGCITVENITSEDYHLYHYQALKCLHESDKNGLKTALDCARISVIKALHNTSLESSKTIYPALSQLRMLREIEELGAATQYTYETVLHKWKEQDSINVNDFQYLEPILTQRAILLQSNNSIDCYKDYLFDTYLQTAELAEKSRHLQTATRALHNLRKQSGSSEEVMGQLHYREAVLAWTKGDQHVGRNLLRNLIAEESLSPNLQVQALRVYGNWMVETKSENPQMLIKKYYERSIDHGKSIVQYDIKNLLDTHAALAQFAHAQYEQIMTYMKSTQFESLKKCVVYSRETAAKLKSSERDLDIRRAANINEKLSRNDDVEFANVEKDKNMYLILALRHYLTTLRLGEDHNRLVFRLVSLWLENKHHLEVVELLNTNLNKIASYKFVPMVPQLAPHMSNFDDVFTEMIYALLQKCAIEHPHHTLPVLLALMNLYEDYNYYDSKKYRTPEPEPRVLGAKKLVQQLTKTKVNPIIQEMNKLAHSLIQLANFELPKGRASKNRHLIPNDQEILKIENFMHTLVPTLTIDVKPSMMYDNIVGVRRYNGTFESVGGVNAPKKIICIGTDGRSIIQLVKGKDDLRQDAVMQQVFTVMNSLLRSSNESKRRKLNVRTYKVVPLTQRSGVLEWCENTIPIDTVLVGSDQSSGLHKKYYPKDYTARMCRKKMEAVANRPFKVKLKMFTDCCKNLHPVFHYFFMEKYPSPEVWFERKLAYVRSVATTSIIGYILGLGDRHLHNILIDNTTAEVIHIDFGIAFEQGKILPTPETIPFRLTRDIEVAMGVSGVEGVMRRSCEETMNVLRDQREIIITLLQVLLYDPLFSWAITPNKACNIQSGNTQRFSEDSAAPTEINNLAERALLRLEQKLQGIEEGSASSVAGQVERLFQEARDHANFCRLYCGWQAYL